MAKVAVRDEAAGPAGRVVAEKREKQRVDDLAPVCSGNPHALWADDLDGVAAGLGLLRRP